MDVVIRKATLKDVSNLIPLALKLMTHIGSLHKEDKVKAPLLKFVPNIRSLWKQWATKWIKSPNGLVLVAEVENKIIGFSLNHLKENVKVYTVRKIGHISDLYVEKEHRGKGIASELKKQAFAWFKKKGMRYASISAYPLNEKPHSIYKNWGFFDFHIELRRRL